MQQLSTGKRINNAVDDVAGMAISTRLTSQIRGLAQAVRNANDGISLLQTAEGATGQVTNMLQRMRELAVQASNDTNNDRDRGFLDGEFQQLKAEIDRIGQNTQWNGANILDGVGGNKLDGVYAFQVGANSDQTIKIALPNMQTAPDAPIGSNLTTVTPPLRCSDCQFPSPGRRHRGRRQPWRGCSGYFCWQGCPVQDHGR
jgi:flagellin